MRDEQVLLLPLTPPYDATIATFRRSDSDGSRWRPWLRPSALTRLIDRGYTTPAMRIVTSVLLAAIVLTLPLSVIAAPSQQSTVDIKSLALTKADLQWRGFEMVPDRTVSEDRPDGVAVYDITFARERTADNLASGPFEVRSGVARTAAADDAVLQLDSTKEAFLNEGWAQTGVPPLGDDALGLTQTTDADGGKIAHFSYLFRKGSYILMIGVRGRPDVTKVQDAVGLAIIVSGRLDKALGSGGAPAPSTGSSSAAAPPSGSSTTARQATGERVRVVNAEGGSVNMRAEPSTSADVVTQVAEGSTLDIVGANRDADGRTWRNVQTSDRKAGWIASTFLETISAPPAAPSPSPLPRAASATPTPDASQPAASAATGASTEATAEASPSPSPSATTQTAAAPAAAGSGGANTFRGSGNGLEVEGFIRELSLSSGKQQVKVKVTRGGGGVGDAFVDVTARLDANRFRAIKIDKTNQDGYTEIEFDMEGPPGTYEVIIDVKTDPDGPVTTAKSSFRWKQ